MCALNHIGIANIPYTICVFMGKRIPLTVIPMMIDYIVPFRRVMTVKLIDSLGNVVANDQSGWQMDILL